MHRNCIAYHQCMVHVNILLTDRSLLTPIELNPSYFNKYFYTVLFFVV